MKILLACLMCLVLSVAECFAVKGGPDYTKTRVSTTGNYAGVFAPTIIPGDPDATPPTQDQEADNSLALFSVMIPATGLGTGRVVVFREGRVYRGTMDATADPDSAKLFAVIETSFIDVVSRIIFSANGKIPELRGIVIRPNSNIFSSASARLKGEARLTYTPNLSGGAPVEVTYSVIGFKQG